MQTFNYVHELTAEKYGICSLTDPEKMKFGLSRGKRFLYAFGDNA
jgi:hypothetical protein